MTHQGDGCRLNGYIAPTAHRNPDVGLGQRRRVVDAVTDHRHLMPLALQALDSVSFTVRQHAGDHFVDACFFGNRVGGRGVIPGQHHQTITLAVQASQRSDAIATQRVANSEQCRDLAIDRQQHRRCPL